MTKRIIVFLALIAVVGFAVGAFRLMDKPSAAAPPEPARAVAVVPVQRSNLARDITFSAELLPFQEADLHAKVAGYLKTIRVDIGDRVKEGETLATLDVPELRDEVAHADAAFHDSELNYQRIEEVVKQKPGLLAQADVDNAEGAFEMAKATRERAMTMMSYAKIIAPFDGVITKRYVHPGALIQSGTNSSSQAMPVVHIADDSTLRLTFPVQELVVPQVHNGTEVDVTIDATGKKISNKVTRMADKVDTATRTMDVEVDLDNRDHSMTPGMYASARLVLEHKTDVLTLPVEAVSAGDKPTVWIVNAKNEIEERPVKIGLRTDSKVEVLSGVKEGENVVFGSRASLVLGDHVKPKLVAAQVDNG